jgi:hypothetical protein
LSLEAKRFLETDKLISFLIQFISNEKYDIPVLYQKHLFIQIRLDLIKFSLKLNELRLILKVLQVAKLKTKSASNFAKHTIDSRRDKYLLRKKVLKI